MRNQIDVLVKITEIAPRTPYSAEYLSLRARSGKLTAQKIGNTWYTTDSSINEYRARQDFKKLIANGPLTIVPQSTSKESIVHRPSSIVKQAWLIKWVVSPISALILLGFIPIQALKSSVVFSMGILNDLSDQSALTFQDELRQTIGSPPKSPTFIHNFTVYSRLVFNELSSLIAQPISGWYEDHPLILAASRGNFPEIRSLVAEEYGPTSQSFFSILTMLVTRAEPKKITEREAGIVAGVHDTRGSQPFKYRTIIIDGQKGVARFEKGEQTIVVESVSRINSFRLTPTRELIDHQPNLNLIDPNHVQIRLTKPALDEIDLLWFKY